MLRAARDPDVTDSSLTQVLGQYDEVISRSPRLSRVRALVVARLPEATSLEEAAAAACLTPSSLSRLFRQKVGCSYSRWLRLLRLARVLELLRDTDRSVRAIAHDAGFGCPRSFRRASHDAFELDPRSLRAALRNREEPAVQSFPAPASPKSHNG
jgi:transcriptional regulator GlxA family with amidase domain